MLREDEKIIGDKGYRQEEKCWCPPAGKINELSVEEKIERRKVTRIRQITERMIGRITSWGVFKRKWNKNFFFHKLCAHVAARFTQLEVHAYPLT